jgi:hypothetical protein
MLFTPQNSIKRTVWIHNNTVVSNHFHSVKKKLFSSARSRDFDGMFSTELPVSMYTTKIQSICVVLAFDPQLKKILTFSVKDSYQLNYFICIKDFNVETITSLRLNLFSFFIYDCQYHQRKTICLYVYISDIRQIVGYRTPVFIQRFPWRLHITISYNLQRCHNNSVNTESRLPSISDVKTRKRRNVVGIDMIRNNRIALRHLFTNYLAWSLIVHRTVSCKVKRTFKRIYLH